MFKKLMFLIVKALIQVTLSQVNASKICESYHFVQLTFKEFISSRMSGGGRVMSVGQRVTSEA